MKKGSKNPHNTEWNKKIREGVARQHKEGRGNSFISEDARKQARIATWKGEEVGRVGLHRWVAYWKGRPRECEKCGSVNKKKYEWANVDHKYRRVLDDYIRMCTSCHRLYDMEFNNYKQK